MEIRDAFKNTERRAGYFREWKSASELPNDDFVDSTEFINNNSNRESIELPEIVQLFQ